MRKVLGAMILGLVVGGVLLVAFAQRPAATGVEMACKGCEYDDGRKAG